MRMIRKFLFAWTLVGFALLCACSEKEDTAGTCEESEGLYAVQDKKVAGVLQKGPFAKGSHVTVRGMDCKTLELSDEVFEGEVQSDKGDYVVGDVTLSSPCAEIEAKGYYFNEVSGKKTSEKMTLRVLTNLKERETVNVNAFTHLESDRIRNLVAKKNMDFADAKKQAEEEVLAALDVVSEVGEFENLNIFEQGDGNAALLAVSVLMQVPDDSAETIEAADVAERLDKISSTFAEKGSLGDGEKAELADWAASAKEKGLIDTIRKNIESWGYVDELPEFENYMEKFEEKQESEEDERTEFDIDWSRPKEAYLNPDIVYDSIVDERDGQVYKVVTIGEQVWMAQNLNYADSVSTPSLLGRSWCYEDNPEYCAIAGRFYTWAAAIDSVKLANDAEKPRTCGFEKYCEFTREQGLCPNGWHLPDTTEWNVLIATAGGSANLMSKVGWLWDYGTDAYGFSAFPAGEVYRGDPFTYADTRSADFFALTDQLADVNDGRICYFINLFGQMDNRSMSFKDSGFSIRCVKD